MNYRESFNMSNYSHDAFIALLRKIVDKTGELDMIPVNNSAELLLSSELMMVDTIECAPANELSDVVTELVSNYKYLVENVGDSLKLLPMDNEILQFLITYVTKTFDNHEEVK